LQNRQKPVANNRKKLNNPFYPPAPLRRQRIAESTTSLARTVTLATPRRKLPDAEPESDPKNYNLMS
jgi:hypothetical protein